MPIYNFKPGNLFVKGKLVAKILNSKEKLDSDFGGKFFSIEYQKQGYNVKCSSGETIGLFDRLIFTSPDNYFLSTAQNKGVLFDLRTGKYIDLSRIYNKHFAVSREGLAYPINHGIVEEPFKGKVFVDKNRTAIYTNYNGRGYILVYNELGGVDVVDTRKRVVIDSITKDPNADIQPLDDVYFDDYGICFIVKDNKRNVVITDKGVLFEAALHEEIKFSKHGESYMFNAYDKERDISSMVFFNEHQKRIYKSEIPGMVIGCKASSSGESYVFIQNKDGELSGFFTQDFKHFVKARPDGTSIMQPARVPKKRPETNQKRRAGSISRESEIDIEIDYKDKNQKHV